MDEKRNNRTVERRLKDALHNDRARIQVGRISHFGLLEMSRQRIRTSVLESSTEKCTHCGGTGHVRSVSSVSLQLLRSLEETLLKGPTHNLIARTRPEIALYLLNQKRAHLRELEERFHIAITVNADAEVGGQIGFVIDRGEQVMTPEQARGLLVQSDSAPLLYEEEEPVSEETVESAEDGGTGDGETEQVESVEQLPEQATNEAGRGRRRRRRRGGRGSEGRDHGQASHLADEKSHREQGELTPDHAADNPEDAADVLASEAMGSPDNGNNGNNGNGNGNGNGEHRRRRRGRRGGRHNRRGRDPQHAEPAAGENQGHQDAPDF